MAYIIDLLTYWLPREFRRKSLSGHQIYSDKATHDIRETGLAHSIQLADKLFHKGRTLYIDNFYTIYELSISCLNGKTYAGGTLKKPSQKALFIAN